MRNFRTERQGANIKIAWDRQEADLALVFFFSTTARANIHARTVIAVGVIRFVYRLETLADVRLQHLLSARKCDNGAWAA